ncbi:unnamed protein product [Soboliphyme baturini]|uniref:Uncharacterized protein n=1 Tax=Soboliphyme baturini TaxID=241478 RepID=A0A183ITM1_9BILA|nr:unnamed protein product [Soboliphyme baturini]
MAWKQSLQLECGAKQYRKAATKTDSCETFCKMLKSNFMTPDKLFLQIIRHLLGGKMGSLKILKAKSDPF